MGILASSLLVPAPAFAQSFMRLNVFFGTQFTIEQILTRVIDFLAATIGVVCTVAFISAALIMVISRGKEDQLSKAKDLMIGSVWGIVLVLASRAILRSLVFVIYS